MEIPEDASVEGKEHPPCNKELGIEGILGTAPLSAGKGMDGAGRSVRPHSWSLGFPFSHMGAVLCVHIVASGGLPSAAVW
ncbi:hypothetical protein CIB84_011598 [Bambusicola thoracicus]|uniref:Uncharacterized protein n=1 Tax=Bambusicola thoracicus TaxID=9083 RepID=A0A2P4SKM4_BAMTH|nr:hypothetical protein CIB84_011598 [Bambusicola thoracicus]